MGLWGTVTGALDHAAGSTDEAVGRATEQARNGRIWFPGDSQNGSTGVVDELAGSTDEFLARGAADDVVDSVWSGHPGDTISVWGPTLFGTSGSIWDTLSTRAGENRNGDETKTKLLLYGLGAVVLLYLLRPLLSAGAEAVGGDG